MTATLTPYLGFNGNAAEAMKFYQSVLGGELTIQTFGDVKMARTPEEEKRTMHAALKNETLSFMASDGPPGKKMTIGDNISMSIVGSDEKQLAEFFQKLSQDGKIEMPLAKQFWGDTFGMLTDQYGIHWMINITAKK